MIRCESAHAVITNCGYPHPAQFSPRCLQQGQPLRHHGPKRSPPDACRQDIGSSRHRRSN